ncbi:MAG: oligosaccharide flippase family protein, partial [Psychroserpens sp.]|nr:oligosaccharide flippase family protein [Psychroserpens sp.]
ILTSTSSLGTFNGVVKYVSQHETEGNRLGRLFSSAFILGAIGAIASALILFFSAGYISEELFGSDEFVDIIKCLALIPPIIGLNRIFY